MNSSRNPSHWHQRLDRAASEPRFRSGCDTSVREPQSEHHSTFPKQACSYPLLLTEPPRLRVHFAAQPTTRSYHLHWDQHRDPATSQLLLSGSGASEAKWVSACEDRNAVQPVLCEIRHFTDFRRGHFMFMMHHASPMMDEPSDPLGGRQHLDLTAV